MTKEAKTQSNESFTSAEIEPSNSEPQLRSAATAQVRLLQLWARSAVERLQKLATASDRGVSVDKGKITRGDASAAST
jgi:hypothetical protein